MGEYVPLLGTLSSQYSSEVLLAQWLVLPTSDHKVLCSNPAGDGFQLIIALPSSRYDSKKSNSKCVIPRLVLPPLFKKHKVCSFDSGDGSYMLH